MRPVALQLTADFHAITRTLVALLNGDHGRAREPGLRDHLHHMLLASEIAYQQVMDTLAATLAEEPPPEREDERRVPPWARDVRRGTFASAIDSCDHLLGERDHPAAPVFRRAVPRASHQDVLADLRPRLVRSQHVTDRLRDYRRAALLAPPPFHHPAVPWYSGSGMVLRELVVWSPLLNDLTLRVENWNFALLVRALAHLDAGTPFIGLAASATDVLQIDITSWHEDVDPLRIQGVVASDGGFNPLEHDLSDLTLLTAVAAARTGGATLTVPGELTFKLQLPEPPGTSYR